MDRSRPHRHGNSDGHQARRRRDSDYLLRSRTRQNSMNRSKFSEELFARALSSIPGGVNSPVRAFRSVGGKPAFMARGQGSRIWDVDGNEYIDYIGSWGPLIFGHRQTEVLRALQEVLEIGTS